MGRILAIALVIMSLTMYGCEAFKSNYNTPPPEVLASIGGVLDELPASGGEIDGDQFASDTTTCESNPAIEVSYPEAQTTEWIGHTGWTIEGDDVTADIEKLGDYSVKITISKMGAGAESLTVTMKQIGERLIAACNAAYTGCNGECVGASSVWSDIDKGSIEVKEFNMADGVFSFRFTLKFAESNVGDPGVGIEGTFISDGYGVSDITE